MTRPISEVTSQQLRHHLAVHVGQAEVAALEAVGQLACGRSRAGAGSSRAGRGRGRWSSTALKPNSSVSPSVMPGLMPPPASHIVKRVGVVVAAVVAALHHRRAAELAAPDDQRVVEQAALLQVLDQRGAGLVGRRCSSSSGPSTRSPCWSQASWKSCTNRTPRSTSRRASRQLLAKRRLARLGAVHLERRASAPRRGPSAPGRCVCIRYAISKRVDPRGDLRVADRVEAHAGSGR